MSFDRDQAIDDLVADVFGEANKEVDLVSAGGGEGTDSNPHSSLPSRPSPPSIAKDRIMARVREDSVTFFVPPPEE